MSTWVYLIRHGEVERAAEGRFFGHTDVALSATGVLQVEAVARQLALEPIEAVYASDLLRARQSAAPLAGSRGLAPVELGALREMAMGRWEGLTFREIRQREPDVLERWLANFATLPFPDGETLEELQARVMPAFREILGRHPGRRVAVVAHGGTNRVILCDALGMPLGNILRLAQDYASWSVIEYRPETAILHTLNQRVAGIAAAPVEKTAVG
ncbi:MAG TPA: histidine phosphatase family protein [Methylomirabilota bacterium]|nr:histidine phosphatase family protein [Methylomirabilota bacterium]